MNGHRIIALGMLVWIACLTSMFFTNNPYLNELIFFLGFMVALCICAAGCEKLEKTGEDFDISKCLVHCIDILNVTIPKSNINS